MATQIDAHGIQHTRRPYDAMRSWTCSCGFTYNGAHAAQAYQAWRVHIAAASQGPSTPKARSQDLAARLEAQVTSYVQNQCNQNVANLQLAHLIKQGLALKPLVMIEILCRELEQTGEFPLARDVGQYHVRVFRDAEGQPDVKVVAREEL